MESSLMATHNPEATRHLLELARGDAPAADRLIPLVYEELRELAARFLQRERHGHTLQATALVHEAYVQLVDAPHLDPGARTCFFAIAARVMRQVLIQHARGRGAQKRGGEQRRITLDGNLVETGGPDLDLLDLDESLTRLAALHERQARVVELRYFAGLSIDEIATVVGVSPRTVDGDWRVARAWLRGALASPEDDS
jgi:RNA polymerase sigma factor (TIGR02999 family)